MKGPLLKFDDDVPRWLRGLVRLWAPRVAPAEWTLRIGVKDNETLEQDYGEGAQAGTDMVAQYLDAHLWLDEEAEKNEDTLRDLLHEIRHPHYEPLMLIFEQAWGRRRIPKDAARKMFRDQIETLIQRDVALFLKAWPDKRRRGDRK